MAGFISVISMSRAESSSTEPPKPAPLLDKSSASSQFITTVWKTGEGLPANEILDVCGTPDGFLWLGTYQGLVRFDGVRFETFFNVPTGSRFGSKTGPLDVDDQGRLWFAPDQVGVICLDKGVFTEVLTNGTILRDRVASLCSDGTNGMMWVDVSGGLGRFSTVPPFTATRLQGAASGGSRWMRDTTGQLWLKSARGLKLYQHGKWRDVPVPGTATLIATPRREGGMWVAREARLRFVTADGKGRDVATVPWAGQSRVSCLEEDSRGRLWIGTVDYGLYCFSGGEFQEVMPSASSISCLWEDLHGDMWAGTRGSGLVRISDRQFFIHDLNSGLRSQFVRSLAQDTAGRMWLATAEGGLGRWEKGAWNWLGEENGWRRYEPMSILPSSDGGVWISTANRNLLRWANGKLTRQNLGPKPPDEAFMGFLEDRKKRLWMVTDNSGVYCLDNNKLTRYSTSQGLPSGLIRCLVEDENGEIWAGDWEGGIAQWKDKRFEIVRKPSGHRDAVRSMVATNGALWIGTSAGGLLRFKSGQTARISIDEGLPDVCIQQLLLDGRGSLWGCTAHTLFQIPMAQLNAVADGKLEKVTAISYGRNDGLPDLSFAAWCDPRSWRTADGELWFATANGAVHFHPGSLRETKPPQVFLEQMFYDGKPATAPALQQLRPGPGRVEFRFTAPCLIAPERVRFRYQLTGVDRDWIDAGAARTATYASIPPGHHEFRVMASSPDGVWGTKPATISLAVHPFFWQTNWFFAGIAAVGAGGCVWAARRATVRRLNRRLEQLRQQQALDRERARIAQDIHDELGANLTSIGLLADLGVRHKMDSNVVARELSQISQTARESVAAMDAIVWALNPRNDSLDHFANYVAQFTRDFFRPTQLRTRLDLPPNLPEHPMNAETRHQLFLIVKESFNNIVRHAQATEVSLEVACCNGDLRLVIADNGKGLPAHAAAEGQDGLMNLQERVKGMGGNLNIESDRERGTRLEFVVPLKQGDTVD